MMETNKNKGGRPRDTFADPYIKEGKNKNGELVKICVFCDHQFGIKTSVTRIKAHLGKVEKQDVALCTKVPIEVEEAARNSMPNSSSKRSNTDIISNRDTLQPIPRECCTSNSPPPTIESSQEQCPMLRDSSLQQSNVDVQLNPLLQNNTQQLPPQRWHASASPPLENMLPDNSIQELSEDDFQWLSTVFNDSPVNSMNRTTFDTPQPSDSCPTHAVLASQCPVLHQRELSISSSYQDASGRDSVHDTTISQDVLQGGRGVCPVSLLRSTLQEDMSTVVLDDHEDPKSQHHEDSSTGPRPSKMVQAGQSSPTLSELQEYEDWPLSPPQDRESHSERDIAHNRLSQSTLYVDGSEDDTQEAPSQRCSASTLPPLQNMLLDGSIRQTNIDPTCSDVQLDSLGMETNILGHESLEEMQNPSEDIFFPSTILNNPQSSMNEMALNTLQPNKSCSTHGELASEHPMQQHLREFPNRLPYQDVLSDVQRMGSALNTTIPQDFLQEGGAYPNSLPRSAHREDIPIAEFNDHEGLESRHHMQESLQEDQRINHNLYPSITPQLHPKHIVPLLGSANTSTCAYQSKHEKKRKLLDTSTPTGKKLPLASKFQGPTFNKKVDEIVKSLEDDSVSIIGVYGMGGCGKTTIMKYIHNQLLEQYIIPFTHVIWVDVYQDHTVSKLQQHLASWLDLTLPHNGGQIEWAAKLNEKMQNMRYALILDNVWDDINLEEVGIPEPSQENKCKLMLTTRSRDVCNKMNCNRAILLNLLSKEEAEELFVMTLGDTPKNLIRQSIMKEVIKKCACLPLAIVVIAKGMRGKSECEWRNALDTLQDGTNDEEKSVIRNLEFSFRNLSKPLQQCLLYCALYPNDILKTNKKKLIEMLITEGAIGSKRSLKSAEDHVQTILKKLENACLLTRDYDGFVMHDLIRDMCVDIVEGRFLVKCHLKFPPDKSEFTEVVEKVSLMCSEFQDLSLDMRPSCPKLSTLLLSYSSLTRISKYFFMGDFPMLQVLDLSETSIQELPNSVSNLVSLNALVLQGCRQLRYLPSLAPLTALKKLDLYLSGIKKAPEGLEKLVNLTYLDLDETDIETFPSLSLRSLVKLQYLKLPGWAEITMRDVKELKNLEVLKAGFANWEDFIEYGSSMLNSGQKLFRYHIHAIFTCVGASGVSMEGTFTIMKDEEFFLSPSRDFTRAKAHLGLWQVYSTRGENFLSCEVMGQIPSPEIIQELSIKGGACDIEEGQTEENGEPKGLFDVTFLNAFPNLLKLEVCYIDFAEDLISASSSVVESNFSLSRLVIRRCNNKLVRLVDPKILPCFQNLQFIEITHCDSIESIISSPKESNNSIILPNLRRLYLWELPNLGSICGGTLISPSIESIEVWDCPKLKKLPLDLTELDINSRQPTPPLFNVEIRREPEWLEIRGRSEWWESLEWDQPHAKDRLQPYFRSSYW